MKQNVFVLTILVLIGINSACNNVNQKNEKPKIEDKKIEEKEVKLKIGDKYQGGYIFYLDFDGKHGKICAPYGEGDKQKYLLEDAIDKAEKMKLNGYDDWRLPSVDELQIVYNLNKNDLFLFNGYYWTSDGKEGFDSVADKEYICKYYLDMTDGGKGCWQTDWEVDNEHKFRVVREF